MATGSAFWVAVAFAAALVVFFMFISFKKHTTPEQGRVVRLLAALCAGFAGGLFTGNALFTMDSGLGSGAKWTLTASAGFALFSIVWFFWKDVVPKAPDAFSLSVPKGASFQGMVDRIAQNDNALAQFHGFTTEQLQVVLAERKLDVDTPKTAIESLGQLAPAGALPSYTVQFSKPNYILRAT